MPGNSSVHAGDDERTARPVVKSVCEWLRCGRHDVRSIPGTAEVDLRSGEACTDYRSDHAAGEVRTVKQEVQTADGVLTVSLQVR